MIAFLVSAALAAKFDICFYDKDAQSCPAQTEQFSISDFGEYQNKQYNDATIVNYHVAADMPKNCVISFSKFSNDDISFSIRGIGGQRIVFLDMCEQADSKAGHLVLHSVQVKPTNNPKYLFENLAITKTTIENPDKCVLTVRGRLDADPISMIPFPLIKPGVVHFMIGNKFPKENPYVCIDESVSQKVFLIISNVNTDTVMSLVGDQMRFAPDKKPNGSFTICLPKAYPLGNHIKVKLDNGNGTLYVCGCAHGPNYRLPIFDVELSNKEIICFRNSTQPNSGLENREPLVNVTVIDEGYLFITNTLTPFTVNVLENAILRVTPVAWNSSRVIGSITLNENSEIHFTPPYHYLIRSLFIDKVVWNATKALFNCTDNFNLDIVVDEDIHFTVGIGELVVLPTSKPTFIGNTFYTFGKFPEEIVPIKASNLKWNATELHYNLSHSQTIEVEGQLINPSFINVTSIQKGEITQELVDEYKGTDLPFVCAPRLVCGDFPITFPQTASLGFSSSSTLFSPKCKNHCIKLEMTQTDLKAISHQFCYSNDASLCPPNYMQITNVSFKTFLPKTAQEIFFYFVDTPKEILDFDEYAFNKGLKIFLQALDNKTVVTLSKAAFENQLHQINARNLILKVDNTESNFYNNAILNISKTQWDLDTKKHLYCPKSLDYVWVDYISFNDLTENCRPQNIVFKPGDFNSFKTIMFRENFIEFRDSTSGFPDKNLSVTMSEPYLWLYSFSDEVKFTKDGSKKLNPRLFYRNVLTGHRIVIDDADWPEDFSINGTQLDGTLVALGKVAPIDFRPNVKVNIESKHSFEMKNHLCLCNDVSLTGMNDHTTYTQDAACFGVNSNIKVPEDVTLRVIETTFAQVGTNTVPIPKLVQVGKMNLYQESFLRVDDFQFEDDEKVDINMYYRLARLPGLRIDSKSPTKKPRALNLIYVDEKTRPYSESSYVAANKAPYYLFNYDIVCGNQMNCEEWNINFISETTDFNGSTSILKANCIKKENEYCVRISLKDAPPAPSPSPPTPDSSDSQTAAIIGGIVGGIGLIAIIVIVAIVALKKKSPEVDAQPLITQTVEENT